MTPRTTNHTPDIARIFARNFQWHRLLNFLFPYVHFLPSIRFAFDVFRCYGCTYKHGQFHSHRTIARQRGEARETRDIKKGIFVEGSTD